MYDHFWPDIISFFLFFVALLGCLHFRRMYISARARAQTLFDCTVVIANEHQVPAESIRDSMADLKGEIAVLRSSRHAYYSKMMDYAAKVHGILSGKMEASTTIMIELFSGGLSVELKPLPNGWDYIAKKESLVLLDDTGKIRWAFGGEYNIFSALKKT